MSGSGSAPLGSGQTASSKSPERARVERSAAVALSLAAASLAWFVEASPAVSFVLSALALTVLLWPKKVRPEGATLGLGQAQRTTVLLVLAVAMLVIGVKDDVTRLTLEGKVRAWNVYHYYFGAKYFRELGYNDLYRATLEADRQSDDRWHSVEKLRDLESYRIIQRSDPAARFDRTVFSADRWQELQSDLSAIQKHRSASGWRNVLRDRGYNGTPLWTAVGRGLTALAPADTPRLLLLCSLDLVLVALTSFLVLRTFGASRAVMVLLLFVASPTNVGRLGGGFLQTDWLCAIVASLCFLYRRRPTLAGGFMAYAVMTRIFPIVFVAGAMAPPAWDFIRGRPRPRFLSGKVGRYVISVGAFCLLGFGVGLANGRGLSGWVEFAQAITVHRDQHTLGDRRIGLEHAFTAEVTDLVRRGEATPDEERVRRLTDQRPLFLGTAVAFVVLFVLAAAKRSSWDAQILSIVLVFTLMVLSRYYHGVLALLPLLHVGEASRARLVTGGQLAAFVGYHALVSNGADWHTGYAALNLLLALYFVVLLAWLASVSRLRTAVPASVSVPTKPCSIRARSTP